MKSLEAKSADSVKDSDEDYEEADDKNESIDLTIEQKKSQEIDGLDEMDDFDLMEASIDKTDIKSRMRVEKLKAELDAEKTLIQAKLVFKAAFGPDDPMRIYE